MKLVRLVVAFSLGMFLIACNSEQEAQAAEPAPEVSVPLAPMQPVVDLAKVESDLPEEQKQQILANFAKFRPDVVFRSLSATAMAGLYEAEIESGGLVYLDASGEFFLSGELYRFTEQGIASVSEDARTARRLEMIQKLDRDQLISFEAKGDDVTDIYVFTDVHCGYCARLHNEVDELAKLGVRVNYLAYPRGGNRSQAYPIMKSVWCSKDRQKAITEAKANGTIEPVLCDTTVIEDHYELGNRAGINATPAIMFADGSLELGYIPSANLAVLAKMRR